MPIETHLHHDPLWSLVVVFGVNLALPLLLTLAFLIGGLRREGNERGAYFGVAQATIVVCVLMQLLCASYHARLLAGTVEVGTVTQKEEIASSRYPQCELTLQTAHGELELDVHQGYCRNGLDTGTSVPIITVAGWTMFAQAGERATAHVGLTFGVVPLMLLVLLWVLIRSPARREP